MRLKYLERMRKEKYELKQLEKITRNEFFVVQQGITIAISLKGFFFGELKVNFF